MNRCPSCGGVLFIEFEMQKEDEKEMELLGGKITCVNCILRWEFQRVADAEVDAD